MTSPAFQFYPKDYQNDEAVRLMTHEERGIYIDLMCAEWNEGSIPADVPRIGRILRVSLRKMRRVWQAVGEKFEPHPDLPGRLVHPLLERERRKQREWREKRSAAGKKGARKRWGESAKQSTDLDTSANGPPTAKRKPRHSPAIAKPMAEPMAPDSIAVRSLQSSTLQINSPAIPPLPEGQDVLSNEGEADAHRAADRACILDVWHRGAETIEIDGKPIGMGLEMTIRQGLCDVYGAEEVHGALPYIRQTEGIPLSEPVSLRLPESRPDVMSRLIAAWRKDEPVAPQVLELLQSVDVDPPSEAHG